MGTAVTTSAAGNYDNIASMPAAGAITGAELVHVSQGGEDVQSTVTAIQGGGLSLGLACATATGQNLP